MGCSMGYVMGVGTGSERVMGLFDGTVIGDGNEVWDWNGVQGTGWEWGME